MKIKAIIEFELDEGLLPLTEDMRIWLEQQVLSTEDNNLILHSNEIGDSIGTVTSIQNIEFIMHEIKP